MKNLAGHKESDRFIQIELKKAGIPFEKIEAKQGECQYTIIGKLKDWTFTRAWYYWIASTENKGLPISIASKMHNKKYPDEMFDHDQQMTIYGNSIRVEGHCGCPAPEDYCKHEGYVSSYHVDTQEGLNELARVLNEYDAEPHVQLK